MENRLYRDEQRKMIGGVCAGLADYFNVDVSLVRVVFVLALILKGGGLLFYLVLWVVVPRKPYPIEPMVNFGAPPRPEPLVPSKKGLSTAGLIGGLVLIMLGSFLLLDQYDLIPDFEFDKFWPVILIVIGCVMMFGFWKRKPEEEPPANNENNDTTDTDNSQPLQS